MQSNTFGRHFALASAVVALMLGTAPQSRAQCKSPLPELNPDNFHEYTVAAGIGFTPVGGSGNSGIHEATSFQGGVGKAVSSQPEPRPGAEPGCPTIRRWRLFVNMNFRYDRAGLGYSLVRDAILDNPLNAALQSATAATARYYSTIVDPTFRWAFSDHFTVYGLGGIGWMRRSIVFTGPSTEGEALQPAMTQVYSQSTDSPVFDAAGGVDFGLSQRGGALRLFLEARVVQGLGANSSTRLYPFSAGLRW